MNGGQTRMHLVSFDAGGWHCTCGAWGAASCEAVAKVLAAYHLRDARQS